MFIRYLEEWRPHSGIIENVPLMDHNANGERSAVQTLADALKDLKYSVKITHMCLSQFHKNCSRPRCLLEISQ